MDIKNGIVAIEDTPESWRKFADYLSGKPKLPSAVWKKVWKLYMDSKTWEAKANRVKERDNFQCQGCGTISVQLNAHHETYVRRFCEKLEDLLTLCDDCHRGTHKDGLIYIKLT